jgi:hypothetical protein
MATDFTDIWIFGIAIPLLAFALGLFGYKIRKPKTASTPTQPIQTQTVPTPGNLVSIASKQLEESKLYKMRDLFADQILKNAKEPVY